MFHRHVSCCNVAVVVAVVILVVVVCIEQLLGHESIHPHRSLKGEEKPASRCCHGVCVDLVAWRLVAICAW